MRVAYTDEREIQHALDAGALVLVVPTVDTVEEAIEARNWAYFPPLGTPQQRRRRRRSTPRCGAACPGGYRNTINDNLVLVLMIETLEGLKNADAIAKVPGVTAVFAASGDLGNFSGYRQGTPDYERAINIVHDAAIKARRAAVRSVCLARPAGFHLLPGGQRDSRDCARRGRANSGRWPTRSRNPKSARMRGANDRPVFRPAIGLAARHQVSASASRRVKRSTSQLLTITVAEQQL